jgi:putative transposase
LPPVGLTGRTLGGTGRPKLPNDKHKTEGRNLLTYTHRAVTGKGLKRSAVQASGLSSEVLTKHPELQLVRIVAHKTHSTVVEGIYEKIVPLAENLNPAFYAGGDLGLDHLVTITSNKPGFAPAVVTVVP